MARRHDYNGIWPGIAVSGIIWLVGLVVGAFLLWLFWA
jgi:hypothetical protein